ncbi:ATP-dependent DNA helicase PIF1-like protein [Tanacetum coccineum]
MKLDNLMKDLKDRHIFGHVKGAVYTIEFQKRGLPHCHILLWLEPEDKITTTAQIDQYISAEIPNKNEDPELYQIVTDHMMHGPCGADNPSCPCTIDFKCTKKFPKQFNETTVIDDNGYAIYKRRNDGNTITKSGTDLHNGYVVPYNPGLLRRYQSHINVEWCNQIGSIKYLFKYINKGPDRVTAAVDGEEVDEIKDFYDCRYLSACEAAWRIYGFDIHYRTPPVERLPFHLQDEQSVIFDATESIDYTLEKSSVNETKFVQWMELNKANTFASTLLYAEIPNMSRPEYVWGKTWHKMAEDVENVERIKQNNPANNTGGMFFVYGYGGTGKTYLYKTMLAALRSQGEIVLNVASSGIAALLLEGGRTAHSRFAIPINILEDSMCHIPADSDLADLIRKAKLIIWDEAPMIQSYCYEAFDRTLRDICRSDPSEPSNRVFGGKVVLFGGDFRQMLPVIPNASRNDVERAILAPTHEMVDIINERMMALIPGEETIYESSDSVSLVDDDTNFDDSIYTTDFLNGIKMSGLPKHAINKGYGCNGTRLQVLRMGINVIEGKIISGGSVGKICAIPRMPRADTITGGVVFTKAGILTWAVVRSTIKSPKAN